MITSAPEKKPLTSQYRDYHAPNRNTGVIGRLTGKEMEGWYKVKLADRKRDSNPRPPHYELFFP